MKTHRFMRYSILVYFYYIYAENTIDEEVNGSNPLRSAALGSAFDVE
jgi:hypothetical protein